MRKKTIAQRAIFDQSIHQLIRLIQPEKVLRKIDAVLDQNCRMIDIVHDDLTKGSQALKGEDVPANEKILSIFEQHTDVICRGKTQSPAEFGHKVFFVTGKSGLVTQYEVLLGNPGDNELLPGCLVKHKSQYRKAPYNLSGDRRFFSDDNETKAAKAGVVRVSICKPGYRSKARRQLEKERWFKTLQRFRAGIEGIISGLMRGLGLKRCIWKGWESFRTYVSIGVLTFNLRKVALLLR